MEIEDLMALKEQRYESRHFERVTGGRVNANLLRQWVNQGLILGIAKVPDPAESKGGRGHAKKFHVMHVYQVALLDVLKGAGLDAKRAGNMSATAIHKMVIAKNDLSKMPRFVLVRPGTDKNATILEGQISGLDGETLAAAAEDFGGAFILVDVRGVLRKAANILRQMNDEDEKVRVLTADANREATKGL